MWCDWCHSHVSTGQHCQPAELRLGYTLNRCAGEVAAWTRRTLARVPGTSSLPDTGGAVTHLLNVWRQVCSTAAILRAHNVGTAPASVFGFTPKFLITPFIRFSCVALNPANPVVTLYTTRPIIKNCTFSMDLRTNSDYFRTQNWLFS